MRHSRTGWVITDFSIQLISGCSCSLMHCCTFPLETREEVIAYFKHWGTPEAKAWCEKGGWSFSADPKVLGVMEGREVFDETGQPLYEFCNGSERVVRFPDELRADMSKQRIGFDQYGKATTYEEAYLEGWFSFMEAWSNEKNPYSDESWLCHRGYRDGRVDAVKVGI